jgi:hypothetical protein
MIILRRKYKTMTVVGVAAAAILLFGTGGVTIARFSSAGDVELIPGNLPGNLEYSEAEQLAKEAEDQKPGSKPQDKPQSSRDPATSDKKKPGTSTDKDDDSASGLPSVKDDDKANSATPGSQPTVPVDDGVGVDPLEDPDQAGTVTITYTDAGFVPISAPIAAGTKAYFVNGSTADFWPAASDHPGHLPYPGLDAGLGIPPGASWSFVFGQVGTWHVHDHLKPAAISSITVQ